MPSNNNANNEISPYMAIHHMDRILLLAERFLLLSLFA